MRILPVVLAMSLGAGGAPAWAHEVLEYFAYGRAELSERGYDMAREVIRYAAAADDPHIIISGHIDTAEAEEFGDELGLGRAQAVPNELVKLGMDPARIEVVSRGDSMLARPTPAGVREPLNRRVSVAIQFGRRPEAGFVPLAEGTAKEG